MADRRTSRRLRVRREGEQQPGPAASPVGGSPGFGLLLHCHLVLSRSSERALKPRVSEAFPEESGFAERQRGASPHPERAA